MFAAQAGTTPVSSVTYVDDVFSATTYTGNGSTQTITNGINLSTNGGTVWTKMRDGAYDHYSHDTARGRDSTLYPNLTLAALTGSPGGNDLASFNSTGYSIGTAYGASLNINTKTYVSWTFRKSARFFDVVTLTGDNTGTRNIAHSLGIAPGLVVLKRTDTAGDWWVWHRSGTQLGDNALKLNLTDQYTDYGTNVWCAGVSAPTMGTSTFSIGDDINITGRTYVAYLFAHDTGADGLIQCGSYTGNGSATGPTVTLGWEPQFLMIKNASGTGSWQMIDAMRGMPVGGADATLQANASSAESSVEYLSPTATGFQITSTSTEVNTNTSTYIYLAIRRPNKPPTLGTQVYNAIARTGTGAAATVTGVGFAPDSVWANNRTGGYGNTTFDRLRGATKALPLAATGAETTASDALTVFGVDGFTLGADTSTALINQSAASIITWCFRRAPSVFDVVRYTGNGGTNAQNHSLGVVPELIFLRNLISANWRVAHSFGASSCVDNMTFSGTNSGSLVAYPSVFSAQPTSTVFSLYGTATESNANTNAYTAYLFATKSGVSKVGTYTGTGVTNAINCGFTTGARFVMIKRTDSTGDWYVWDTTRGIIAGNDPYLLLNSAAAEVTSTDYIDPSTAGFELSSTAPAAINANGGTFIYLALA